MAELELSVVVISFDMPREIPRTVRSLSPQVQRGVAAHEYEIIVVDNGSTSPIDREACSGWGAQLRFHKVQDPAVSPARAINEGIRLARGDLIGVFIDGARMASPGLLNGARQAGRLHPRSVVSTPGFHLGPDVQYRSIFEGYSQRVEDELLENSRWTEDAYNLFDISVFAGSSQRGWFQPFAESNALFLSKKLWEELGGYEERFVSRGGGLVNFDTYGRACELPDSQLVVLLGEGTFHQIHGGVATNAEVSPWDEFHSEYVEIRGKPWESTQVQPWYFGFVAPQALASIEESARTAQEDR